MPNKRQSSFDKEILLLLKIKADMHGYGYILVKIRVSTPGHQNWPKGALARNLHLKT